jgi:hypothetical protein
MQNELGIAVLLYQSARTLEHENPNWLGQPVSRRDQWTSLRDQYETFYRSTELPVATTIPKSSQTR